MDIGHFIIMTYSNVIVIPLNLPFSDKIFAFVNTFLLVDNAPPPPEVIFLFPLKE